MDDTRLLSQFTMFLAKYRSTMKNNTQQNNGASKDGQASNGKSMIGSFANMDPTTMNALSTGSVVLRRRPKPVSKVSLFDGVNVPNYRLKKHDVLDEVFDWVSHFLWLKDCPTEFANAIAYQVSKKIVMDMNGQHDEISDAAAETIAAMASSVDSADITSELTSVSVAKQSRQMVDDFIEELSNDPTKISDFAESVTGMSDDCVDSTALKTFATSLSAIKNGRKTMEDRHIIIQDLNKTMDLNVSKKYSYFAVFDGHAGIDAASFSSAHLHRYLVESPAFAEGRIADAFAEAFEKTDSLYIQRLKDDGIDHLKAAGSTAVCVLIEDNRTGYLAWLGDSQAVLVRNGVHEDIMLPHKPDNEVERERITKAGGFVAYLDTWRVNGVLSVARAIGDPEHKPFISAEPSFAKFEIDSSLDFLVLGCDGLFDHLSSQDISAHVFEYLCKNETGDVDDVMSEVSAYLSEMAIVEGSTDNITSIVIFFKPFEELVSTGLTSDESPGKHSSTTYHTAFNGDESFKVQTSGSSLGSVEPVEDNFHSLLLDPNNIQNGHFPYTDFSQLPIGTNFNLQQVLHHGEQQNQPQQQTNGDSAVHTTGEEEDVSEEQNSPRKADSAAGSDSAVQLDSSHDEDDDEITLGDHPEEAMAECEDVESDTDSDAADEFVLIPQPPQRSAEDEQHQENIFSHSVEDYTPESQTTEVNIPSQESLVEETAQEMDASKEKNQSQHEIVQSDFEIVQPQDARAPTPVDTNDNFDTFAEFTGQSAVDVIRESVQESVPESDMTYDISGLSESCQETSSSDIQVKEEQVSFEAEPIVCFTEDAPQVDIDDKVPRSAQQEDEQETVKPIVDSAQIEDVLEPQLSNDGEVFSTESQRPLSPFNDDLIVTQQQEQESPLVEAQQEPQNLDAFNEEKSAVSDFEIPDVPSQAEEVAQTPLDETLNGAFEKLTIEKDTIPQVDDFSSRDQIMADLEVTKDVQEHSPHDEPSTVSESLVEQVAETVAVSEPLIGTASSPQPEHVEALDDALIQTPAEMFEPLVSKTVSAAVEPMIEAVPEAISTPEPIVESVTESVSVPEPSVEVESAPISDPEPMMEVVAEVVSATEAAVEPVAEAVPSFEAVTESVAESVVEDHPIVESVSETVPTPEPVAETVSESVVEAVSEPLTETVPESVSLSGPIAEAVSQVSSTPEPIVEAVPEPEPVSEKPKEVAPSSASKTAVKVAVAAGAAAVGVAAVKKATVGASKVGARVPLSSKTSTTTTRSTIPSRTTTTTSRLGSTTASKVATTRTTTMASRTTSSTATSRPATSRPATSSIASRSTTTRTAPLTSRTTTTSSLSSPRSAIASRTASTTTSAAARPAATRTAISRTALPARPATSSLAARSTTTTAAKPATTSRLAPATRPATTRTTTVPSPRPASTTTRPAVSTARTALSSSRLTTGVASTVRRTVAGSSSVTTTSTTRTSSSSLAAKKPTTTTSSSSLTRKPLSSTTTSASRLVPKTTTTTRSTIPSSTRTTGMTRPLTKPVGKVVPVSSSTSTGTTSVRAVPKRVVGSQVAAKKPAEETVTSPEKKIEDVTAQESADVPSVESPVADVQLNGSPKLNGNSMTSSIYSKVMGFEDSLKQELEDAALNVSVPEILKENGDSLLQEKIVTVDEEF